VRLAFLTSTPMSVSGGSATFVGISVLQEALASLGVLLRAMARVRAAVPTARLQAEAFLAATRPIVDAPRPLTAALG